jgi:hypothetical protein
MMRMMLVLLSFFGASTLGCSNGMPQQKTYPVSGQVLYEGRPVKGLTVVLRPLDSTNFKWQEQPQAVSDDDGKFSIRTYDADDGAPAGEYQVGIAMLDPVDEEGGDQVKRRSDALLIPAKYADPATSGLKVKIEPKSNQLEPFQLVP